MVACTYTNLRPKASLYRRIETLDNIPKLPLQISQIFTQVREMKKLKIIVPYVWPEGQTSDLSLWSDFAPDQTSDPLGQTSD